MLRKNPWLWSFDIGNIKHAPFDVAHGQLTFQQVLDFAKHTRDNPGTAVHFYYSRFDGSRYTGGSADKALTLQDGLLLNGGLGHCRGPKEARAGIYEPDQHNQAHCNDRLMYKCDHGLHYIYLVGLEALVDTLKQQNSHQATVDFLHYLDELKFESNELPEPRY